MVFSNCTLTGTHCVAIRASRKSLPRSRRKNGKAHHAVLRKGATLVDNMKDWEIIADNLSKADWGCITAIESNGRTNWIEHAHRDDGKRDSLWVRTNGRGHARNWNRRLGPYGSLGLDW